MCVCDLGGVYIKPTRPWVVVPLPSSLATIKRRRPVSLCQLVQLTCSPCHLVTWLPGYLFTSGHLVTWSSASHLVIWSSGQLVVWRLASVLSACRLAAASILAHLLRDRGSPIHPLQIHSLLCASASCPSRFNPYFPCPDFTDSMHFLSR